MLRKLDKKTIEKLFRDAELLPPPVRRVLELRQGGAQAAVKKVDALLARAGNDARIRGAFRYHGAATGRWAGQGYQPQNLKRLTVKDEELDAAALWSLLAAAGAKPSWRDQPVQRAPS